jgi:hypothetical protein
MPALLLWLGQFLLRTVASEVFKKAAIFLTFNIVLSFMLSYIGSNTYGMSIFGVGDAVGNLLSNMGSSVAMYALVNLGVVQALFLVLNAHLARFAYRMVFKALGR